MLTMDNLGILHRYVFVIPDTVLYLQILKVKRSFPQGYPWPKQI